MEWTQDKIEKIYQEIRKAAEGETPAAWSEFLESLGIKKTLILWDEDKRSIDRWDKRSIDRIYASDESFVTIFFDKNFNRRESVHLKIPIEAAEKILVLGL